MSSELQQQASRPLVAAGEPLAAKAGTKDEGKAAKANFVYADLLFALLTSGAAPTNGWTMFKLHKQTYKRYATMMVDEAHDQAYFERFWSNETSRFMQGDTTIDLQLFQLLRQVQAYLDCHPRVVDVLHPNKELVWPCEAWLFPKGEHKKFSALPTSSDDQRSSLDETYISKEAGRTASGNNTFEGAPLVIANSPLPDHMDALWSRCGTKFCADGGANRVHDWHIANKHDPHTKHYFPDYLIGDMDSVLAEGCELIGNSGQDNTDLEKTLDFLDTLTFDRNFVLLTGCSGGNIGQEFANYHACWRHAHRQMAFISESGVAMHLAPGKHRIVSAPGLKCSIMPLGEPCVSTTTTGLKWNLENAKLQFGDFISSSNVTMEAEVTIENTHPLIWTFDCAA